MRFVVILIFAAPVLMAFRTLGLFRDWVALLRWSRWGVAAGEAPPVLNDPIPIGVAPDEAASAAGRKLVASALLTAAGGCFALAGGLTLASLIGWA